MKYSVICDRFISRILWSVEKPHDWLADWAQANACRQMEPFQTCCFLLLFSYRINVLSMTHIHQPNHRSRSRRKEPSFALIIIYFRLITTISCSDYLLFAFGSVDSSLGIPMLISCTDQLLLRLTIKYWFRSTVHRFRVIIQYLYASFIIVHRIDTTHAAPSDG